MNNSNLLDVACPDGGTDSPRVIVAATGLALLDGFKRKALETNEWSSHEPNGRMHPSMTQ